MERMPSFLRRPPPGAAAVLPGACPPAAAELLAARRFQRSLFGDAPGALAQPDRTPAGCRPPALPGASGGVPEDAPEGAEPATRAPARDGGAVPDAAASERLDGPPHRLLPPEAGPAPADASAPADAPASAGAPAPAMASPTPPPCAEPPAPGRSGDGGSRRDRDRDPERGAPSATAAESGSLPGGGPPAWLRDTVQRIAWLCTRTDPAFQSWSVTVPMDPAVLPDSDVVLSLSPYAMHLRFRTGSPESAHLISLHRDPLRAQLEALGPGQRGIDIDLEPLP